MTEAWIGLGSNMGDRRASIFEALERMDALEGVNVALVSTLLESKPVDVEDQPDFVNAVARLRTTLKPHVLLESLLAIEETMGRKREGMEPRGPRVIDLDLLLFDNVVMHEDAFQLPHPRMHQRAFVLVPMVELSPELVHPVLGKTMQALLAEDIVRGGPIETRCRPLPPEPLHHDLEDDCLEELDT